MHRIGSPGFGAVVLVVGAAVLAVVVTVSIIAMIVRVRTNAAMKWRKTLAARARA